MESAGYLFIFRTYWQGSEVGWSIILSFTRLMMSSKYADISLSLFYEFLQDSALVYSIVRHVLGILELKGISRVVLRSDNAGLFSLIFKSNNYFDIRQLQERYSAVLTLSSFDTVARNLRLSLLGMPVGKSDMITIRKGCSSVLPGSM